MRPPAVDPSGPWLRAASGAMLLGPDGTPAPTVFAEMSALAAATGAINLGQGFPDEDGPAEVIEAAAAAIRSGVNQYPPGRGTPDLRAAIAEHQKRFYGLTLDPGARDPGHRRRDGGPCCDAARPRRRRRRGRDVRAVL